MAPISTLKYPKKSHRKPVNLPAYSVELAEFFGIMMGDGGIGSSWQFNITLNSKADKDYALYVVELIRSLFNIDPHVVMRKNRNALLIQTSSTSIVDFLIELGLPRGNKLLNELQIPSWILEVPAFKTACVRGLVDTDGCLYIHKHKVSGKEYQNIGFCFCSYSPTLIKQVSDLFEEFGIIPHISNRGRSIYLYKAGSVARYLTVFGTSNARIKSVYEKWRRLIAAY